MIAVDASALVAILLEEPEGPRYRELLLAADGARLSPVGYWEAATRLHGAKGDRGVAELEIVMDNLRIAIEPATGRTSRLACAAERAFGKRAPARLNLGDCFAYALAQEIDLPLLYKGDDFSRTDIRPALDLTPVSRRGGRVRGVRDVPGPRPTGSPSGGLRGDRD